nr:HAD-IIIA family hydrolase [Luteipulveratus halotolerans]
MRGAVRHRGARSWPTPVRAVLIDRDDTLITDVPLNTDPERVSPMPGAVEAVALLRRHGIRLGVVTNQAAVGRGDISELQMHDVNAAVERLLGHFDTWQVCPHRADEHCACRKPAPGLIRRAARELGVPTSSIAVIGDIGTDVTAALRAGARSVLVPTDRTRPQEVAEAPVVATDLSSAAELVVQGRVP